MSYRLVMKYTLAAAYSEAPYSFDELGLDRALMTINYGISCPTFTHPRGLLHPPHRDVARLVNSMNQDAKDKLQHLHLQLVIVDTTGPNGSVEYTFSDDESWDGS